MTKKILILKAVVIPEADTVIVVSLLLLISSSFHLVFLYLVLFITFWLILLFFLQIMITKQEAETGVNMLETMKTTMMKDQVRI